MMLTGCIDYDENVFNGDPVRVELAYTFSPSAAGNQTRQSSKVVVPNATNPRLPDNLMIVPMIGESPQKTETTWNEPVKKVSDRYTSLYYYSQYCDFEPGVDKCLVYGSANDVPPTTGVDSRVYNGKLIPSIDFSTVTDQSTLNLNDLTFDLEPIFKSEAYNETKNTGKDGIPTDASTLAGYLTEVANAHTNEGQYWKNSPNVILKNLFDNFTNYGRNLPGSAASVKALLTALNAVAKSYRNESGTIGETEVAILNAIITNTAADKVTAAIGDVTYPRNINLPDGAAALRWVEVEENNETVKKFMPQMKTTTLDNINTITRFAYPASLYYFVNSGIQTSEGMVSLPTEYNKITVSDTKTAWDAILTQNFKAGGEVTATTRAVALTDPVQYAVAQLQVNTSYSTPSGKPANTLPDAVNANIPVDNNFALKGVIICGQRPVNYNFVPGDNSDALTKFIYDSQVKEDCTLSATSTTAACTTLVLQSYGGEDVNIILEYENNSELTFKCVDGIVYPHTRFYLIGKVGAAGGTGGDEISSGRVFTKDYITTVNMTVTSLAKAYNVLPNLLGGSLELGVELTTKWIQAETTNVLLNESD